MGTASSRQDEIDFCRIWRLPSLNPHWVVIRSPESSFQNISVFLDGALAVTRKREGVPTSQYDMQGGLQIDIASSWFSTELSLFLHQQEIPEVTATTTMADVFHACLILHSPKDGVFQLVTFCKPSHPVFVQQSVPAFVELHHDIQSASRLHPFYSVKFPVIPTIDSLQSFLEELQLHVKNLSLNPAWLKFTGLLPPPIVREEDFVFFPRTFQDLHDVLFGPHPSASLRRFLDQVLETHNVESIFQHVFGMDESVSPLMRGLNSFQTVSRAAAGAPASMIHVWLNSQLPLFGEQFKWRIQHPMKTLDSPLVDSRVLTRLSCLTLYAAFAECHQHPQWQRLFATYSDGYSFHMLASALEGYPGPTLVVCSTTNQIVLGALSTTTWREDSKFYGEEGNNGGALFSLFPTTRIFHRQPSSSSNNSNNNVQYLNSRSKTLPLGLGFGGVLHSLRSSQPDQARPRLFLDETFKRCFTSSRNDTTYAPGDLLLKDSEGGNGGPFFAVDEVEVWALGGPRAFEERERFREQKERMLRNQKQVNKAQFANNAFDREFLLNNTFQQGKRDEV